MWIMFVFEHWSNRVLMTSSQVNVDLQTRVSYSAYTHWRRLRGDWGTVPSKIWCGEGGPCIRPPNISRSSVIGCVWK